MDRVESQWTDISRTSNEGAENPTEPSPRPSGGKSSPGSVLALTLAATLSGSTTAAVVTEQSIDSEPCVVQSQQQNPAPGTSLQQRYAAMANADWFREAYEGKSLGDVSESDA